MNVSLYFQNSLLLCCTKKLECWTNNSVTETIKSYYRLCWITIPVLFDSDLSHHPPCCASIPAPLTQQQMHGVALFYWNTLAVFSKHWRKWAVRTVSSREFVTIGGGSALTGGHVANHWRRNERCSARSCCHGDWVRQLTGTWRRWCWHHHYCCRLLGWLLLRLRLSMFIQKLFVQCWLYSSEMSCCLRTSHRYHWLNTRSMTTHSHHCNNSGN